MPLYNPPSGGGSGTPASTVTDETAFGIAPAVGSGSNFARHDHTHGSPTNPVTAHVAQTDPHNVYVLKSLLSAKGQFVGSSASGVPVAVSIANGLIPIRDDAQTSGYTGLDPTSLGGGPSATPGQLLASDYNVATSNSAATNTANMQTAINALLSSSNYHTLLCDWVGTVQINDELVFADTAGNSAVGARYENKSIRGLSWFATKIQQTDASKGIIIYRGNATASAFSFARCDITDLSLTYSTYASRIQTRAFAIGFENTPQTALNTFFFFNIDRVYIAGAYVGIGLRSNATTWQPNMTVTLNQLIAPSVNSAYNNGNSHYYKVTTLGGGNTGSTEPTWPTGSGSTVTANTVTYTEQGSIQYFPLWGTSIGLTFVEIHDWASQAIKWHNQFGVGQPENKIGNVYLQNWDRVNGTSGPTDGSPAMELENVEITCGSIGIEDANDKLIRMNGDEQFVCQLLHFERCAITVAGSSFLQAKLNTVVIGAGRAYSINGNSLAGQVFEVTAQGTGVFNTTALITSNWSNAGSMVLMKGGGDSWSVHHHGVGGSSVALYASGDTDAADSLDVYNGAHKGGATRVTVSASPFTLTPTREQMIVTTSANRTGGIIANGTWDGQPLVIRNPQAFTLAWNATDSTSHVLNGSGVTVATNSTAFFRWDAGTSRWVKQA